MKETIKKLTKVQALNKKTFLLILVAIAVAIILLKYWPSA